MLIDWDLADNVKMWTVTVTPDDSSHIRAIASGKVKVVKTFVEISWMRY